MSGLGREVLKWLQSLDLTWQIKNSKWDLTNGYLIAEIFSWYFPQEIQMHMYNNGTSLDSKQRNWSLLRNFFQRHKFDIPEEYVTGTIHCKEGAAGLLAEQIYHILTNRQVRKVPPETEMDFTDHAYQVQLPMHARTTASQSVKNNVRTTELMADKNIILGQQKAQSIINRHIEHRQKERVDDPIRFNRKPTLGELAVRNPPQPPPQVVTRDSTEENEPSSEAPAPRATSCEKHSRQSGASRESKRSSTNCFREIEVKQLNSPQTFQQSVSTGY